jgi:hypothetical protein
MMCNSWRFTLLAVGFVSFSAWVERGMAAPTVFFSRDDLTANVTSFPNSQAKFNRFTASLNSFGVDDIEDSNPTLEFGATGITAATQGVFPFNAVGFQIDDRALLEAETFGAPQVNTVFTFNQYITAFGAFVIQGGDLGNNNPTTFRLRDTATDLFVDVPVQVGPGWDLQNIFFLGVHDTVPFDEVEIIETVDATDGMLYDNLVAGFVPEPGSFVLVMLGGACAVCRQRRLRRS